MNRNLANLQFYSPANSREFWGTLGTCSRQPLIGGGLQDNGNVWCPLRPQPQYWQKINGGDGGWVAFIVTGIPRVAFHMGYDEMVSNTMGKGVGHAVWHAPRFSASGTIPLEPPLTGRGSGFDPNGLKGPMAEAVPLPKWAISPGVLMHAVGAGKVAAADLMRAIPETLDGKDIDNPIVFGLFGNDLNDFLYWSEIGRLPTTTKRVSALGTDTGESVYAGTDDGKIFLIDAPSGQVTEMAVDPPPGGIGSVGRIVVHLQRGAFALMENSQGGHLLKLDGGWREMQSTIPLPRESYFALDIYRGGGPVGLAVATDSAVWVSPDDGDTWFRSVSGLPTIPHCADLRFGKLEGADMLFLGTFGRSVWIVGLEDLWETRDRPITGPRHRKFLPQPEPQERQRPRRTAAPATGGKARRA
jgi:hypothetical protein